MEEDVEPPSSWTRVKAAARKSQTVVVGPRISRAYRVQIPLVQFGVSTIHKVLGVTCPLLATRVSATEPAYRLWSHELALVLLSRVKSFSGLLIVGEKDQTPEEIKQDFIQGILRVINMNSPYASHIWQLLERLDYIKPENPIASINPIYYDVGQIPDDIGLVYLLISDKKKENGYVGCSKDFVNRLKAHNSKRGASLGTKLDKYKPWMPAVLVFPFPDDYSDIPTADKPRFQFESQWSDMNHSSRSFAFNTHQMYVNGKRLFDDWKKKKNDAGEDLYKDLKWMTLIRPTLTCKYG